MSFLAPLAFWIAALAVPALLLLYFLKLRRRAHVVSSTLLWRRAVQDLQVNAPFQRLRRNLLLLLQLLVLLAAILALARPIVETELVRDSSVVLLIDRSASMQTLEGDRTRFEMAREQAVRHVKSLNRTGSSWMQLFGGATPQTRVMVIAFAERPRVVSPFTTNMSELVRLIEELTPSDGQTNVREALNLAEAYTLKERGDESAEGATPSTILLISDGAVGNLDDVVLRYASLKLITVGETRDNVGITAMRYQRGYEAPERVSVFAQVSNYGDEEVKTDVTLYVDGRMQKVESVTLAPRRRDENPANAATPETPAPAPEETDSPADAGSSATDDSDSRLKTSAASLTFDFALDQAALVEVRISRPDALLVDNRAFAQIPAPRRLKALVVSDGNFFLEKAIQFLPLENVRRMTPAQYESAPDGDLALDGRSLFDVVVFDKHATARLPIGAYLFIGAAPKIDAVGVDGETGPQAMLWWDESHPILRHVSLEKVESGPGIRLALPPEARKLVESTAGVALAYLINNGRQFALLNFPIEQSSFWHNQSFPKFMYNVVSFLGGLGDGAGNQPVRPGDAVRLTLPAGSNEAVITRPDLSKTVVTPDASGSVSFGATERVGVYSIEPAAEGGERFVVNLEQESESDIAANSSIRVGASVVDAGQRIETATPEVWRWFVGAALLIALFEWYIYNRRVMI